MPTRHIVFFENVKFRQKLLRQKQKQLDRKLSTKFSFFDYLYFGENNLSDIFRDLLDPNGSHGQEDLFLKLFFKQIFDESHEFVINIQNIHLDPEIRREVKTSKIENFNRRIDLVISWGDDLGIGIENKPFDKDQVNQLSDYYDHLGKSFKKFFLIYISELEPTEYSIASEKLAQITKLNQFKLLRYSNEIKSWLEECILYCESQKIKFFLEDLNNKLKNHFMPLTSINENEIVNYALENKDNLTAMVEICKSASALKKEIIRIFNDELRKKFSETEYDFPYNEDEFFCLRKKSWKNKDMFCGLIYNKGELYYSIGPNMPDLYPQIYSSLANKDDSFKGLYNNYNWYFTISQFYNWENDAEKILLLKSNENITEISERISLLIKIIDELQ